MAGRPVLRLTAAAGPDAGRSIEQMRVIPHTIDLASARAMAPAGRGDVDRVAPDFAQGRGIDAGAIATRNRHPCRSGVCG